MKRELEERACELAVYMIETGATVRATARHFGISKSTVHKALTEQLRLCSYPLYTQVRHVLDKNKQERHIRGGLATRQKYLQK
ncbi:MAG TPA: stage III sporulation protein D [Clostridiales bacterium]|nr:stage III sporulation protein D [Clostridiales bacterium]